MSTSTSRAPRRATAPAVAKKGYVGVRTSSPGLMSSAMSPISSASVPDEPPTARAAGALSVKGELHATGADPALDSGRRANDQGIIGHIGGDNRTGPDEGVAPDCGAAYDGAVGSQARPLAHQRRTQLVHANDFA